MSHVFVLIASTSATSTSTTPLIGAMSARNGLPLTLSTSAPRISKPLFVAPLEIILLLPSTLRPPPLMAPTLIFHEGRIVEGATGARNPLPSLHLDLKTREKAK